MRVLIIVLFVVLGISVINCNNSKTPTMDENILRGSATVMVDATVKPVMDDEVEIFESEYDADITLVSRSEAEIVNALMHDSVQIAVLARTLTKEELGHFEKKQIRPRITKIATDGVALIGSKQTADTVADMESIVAFLMRKDSKVKGLVFDNLNSSTVRTIMLYAGVDKLPEQGIYSFESDVDVIKYVSENKGMIGVVGLNWITQPTPDMKPYVEKISVLSVKPLKGNVYVSPTQNNIAEGTYPLARDLFVVNSQGYSGLGMGFASFVAGEKGQRILLKSGLLPARVPARKILLRNQIEKSNK